MSQNQILFFILIFCLNPFLGTLSLFIVKMIHNKLDSRSDYLIFLFITIFVCLLQSTHIWNVNLASDWYNNDYWGLFLNVSNSSFAEYVIMAYKEPLWRLLNYIGYYITNGNYHIFINTIATMTFIIYSYSLFKYWKYLGEKPVVLLSMLVFSLFFIEFWAQINNILRQFFATSIVIYVFVNKVITNKTNWWLLIAACLIHTLCFIYVSLFLFKSLFRIIKIRQLIYIIFAIILVVIILNQIPFLKTILAGISFLSYGLSRLENAGNPIDQNRMDPTSVYITTTLVVGICILMNYVLKSDKKNNFAVNALMFIMIFSTILLNIMPEISLRLYSARFYFWSFVLPLFLAKYKPINTVYAWGIIVFFFTRFLISFDGIRGGGFYPLIADILPRTLIQYLI